MDQDPPTDRQAAIRARAQELRSILERGERSCDADCIDAASDRIREALSVVEDLLRALPPEGVIANLIDAVRAWQEASAAFDVDAPDWIQSSKRCAEAADRVRTFKLPEGVIPQKKDDDLSRPDRQSSSAATGSSRSSQPEGSQR